MKLNTSVLTKSGYKSEIKKLWNTWGIKCVDQLEPKGTSV